MSRTIASVVILVAGTLLAQQHSYTPADIEAGGRLYQTTCGGCHGAAGNAILGVDFGKGQFKQARTDEDLIRVIRMGVPNTSMPPSSFSEAQAATIVAYLRSISGTVMAGADRGTVTQGDADRGKVIFEGKGNCLSCHRVNGNGAQTGPDLSAIGNPGPVQPGGRVLIDRLERALVDPNAEIPPQFRRHPFADPGRQDTPRFRHPQTRNVGSRPDPRPSRHRLLRRGSQVALAISALIRVHLRQMIPYAEASPRKFHPQITLARNLSFAGPGQWVSRLSHPL